MSDAAGPCRVTRKGTGHADRPVQGTSRQHGRAPDRRSAALRAALSPAQRAARRPEISGLSVSGPGLAALYSWEEGLSLRCRGRRAGAVRGGGPGCPRQWRVMGAELYGGRCIMSRSGVFYVVRAMDRVAAGTAAEDVPGAPASRAIARQGPAGVRAEGSGFSLVRRVLAAVHRGRGGVAGRASRRLGGAARAD